MVSSIARVISGSSDSGESPSPPSEGDPSLGQRGGVRVGLGSGVWGWCERTGGHGRTVTLKVKYADFRRITRARSVPETIADRATLEQITRPAAAYLYI